MVRCSGKASLPQPADARIWNAFPTWMGRWPLSVRTSMPQDIRDGSLHLQPNPGRYFGRARCRLMQAWRRTGTTCTWSLIRERSLRCCGEMVVMYGGMKRYCDGTRRHPSHTTLRWLLATSKGTYISSPIRTADRWRVCALVKA